MSSLIKTELLATCNSLGTFDGGTYYKEPDCLESIKDLIRFLKRDDDSHEIRRQLGEAKVIQTDLIHIMKSYVGDKELFSAVLRLLGNLTMPTLIVFENSVPVDLMSRKYYMEITGYLQEYKEAFCDEDAWKVLSEKLGNLLRLDWEHKQEEDSLIFEWILVLIRNILHVPSNPAEEMRTDDDASIHDRVLWGLHKSGIEDLLLFITNSEDYREFSLHCLEIITLMFREQSPQQLAVTGAPRSQSEKQQDEQDLLDTRIREMQLRKSQLSKLQGSRHPRFGGTYCLKNVKSIGDQDLIVHRPVQNVAALNFDKNKSKRKTPKNRRVAESGDQIRRSTLSIRLFLREFCVEFLNIAYNAIMYVVKDQLARQCTQDHDESYYLWAMRFFMEFNRLNDFKVELVSETLSVPTIHYVHTQIENYQEMMISDKKKIALWSKRMHLALKAYYELLMTLGVMDASSDADLRESARVIKMNLFYTVEYRELPYILLHHYDEAKMSKSYLKDLVEMTHVFLKLLENHCKHHSNVIVQKKKKVQKSKKATSKKLSKVQLEDPSEPALEETWDSISSDISAAIQGKTEVPSNIIPFDAASDVPIDEQRDDAFRRIQGFLRAKRGVEAVSLLRASRDVWPQDSRFGAVDMASEDEFMSLRGILFAQVSNGPILPKSDHMETETEEGLIGDGPKEDESEDEEELSEIVAVSAKAEQKFDFQPFVARFASGKVVHAYSVLLHQYAKNSKFTNHCILKMFHRLSWDCRMPALIFQASIFLDFQKILEDAKIHRTESVKEMEKYIKFILGKFFEVVQKNKKVFVELLFWKGSKDAYEIEEGYGTTRDGAKGSAKAVWTEDEEAELRNLHDKFKENFEAGKDVVDLIMENMLECTKTRRQIIRQLKQQGLLQDAKALKRNMSKMVPRDWSEEEIDELRTLYHRYQEAADPLGRILDNLTVKRSKKLVVEKLLELKVVSDKKQLRKKSSKSKKQDDGTTSRSRVANPSPSTSRTSKLKKPNRKVSTYNDNEVDADFNDSSSYSSSDENSFVSKDLTAIVRKAVTLQELRGPIAWVKDDLKDIGNDRKEQNLDPVPLVPIMQENHEALENPVFIKLLKRLGLKPPSADQEIYWRYPISLTYKRCHQLAQILEDALDDIVDKDYGSTNGARETLDLIEDSITLADEHGSGTRDTNRISQSMKSKKRRIIVAASDNDDSDHDTLNAQTDFENAYGLDSAIATVDPITNEKESLPSGSKRDVNSILSDEKDDSDGAMNNSSNKKLRRTYVIDSDDEQ